MDVAVNAGGVDGDHVKVAVAHATFRNDAFREGAHVGDLTAQDHRLEARLMIEVGVHGGNAQVVARVLALEEALAQVALMMVIHVAQVGHAISGAAGLSAFVFELTADEIADRFRAVDVATGRGKAIKFLGQGFFE